MTSVAYLLGFLLGRLTSAIMILSLVLAFVRNQSRKNIVIAGIIACMLAILIGFAGHIDGRLLTWRLAKFLLLVNAIPSVIAFTIATILVICFHWNMHKWFTKVLPWVTGVMYCILLGLALPTEIKEQLEIQQVAKEMRLKEFFALPEYDKRQTAYKIAGIQDGNIYTCVQANQESTEAQEFLLKEVIDICRDIVYGVPKQDDE